LKIIYFNDDKKRIKLNGKIMKKIFYVYLIIISFIIPVNGQFKVLNTEKLISEEGQIFMSPVWSPDGSMIAFTSEGYKGIWIINLQNKNIKQISDETAAGFAFKWSDNSKSILTRVARYEGIRRYNAVKIFSIETGEFTLLTDYRTMMPGLPEFASADEKVFMYGRNQLEIFDSGIEVVPERKLNSSSKIVYLRDDKIAVEDLTTSQLKIFEPIKGERVLNLQLSPDDNKIAFEIIGGDMYVMKIDGTGLTNLGRGYRPKWSPNNQYIVYMITQDDGHQILSSDIYLIKIDGTEKTNLTNTENKLEMNPSWSPDGKKIAYDVLNEGAIYVMEIH
jgi:Tol biopolymer transport system component